MMIKQLSAAFELYIVKLSDVPDCEFPPGALKVETMDLAEFARHVIGEQDTGYDEVKDAISKKHGVSDKIILSEHK